MKDIKHKIEEKDLVKDQFAINVIFKVINSKNLLKKISSEFAGILIERSKSVLGIRWNI